MAVIVENGSGVFGANSYNSVAEVTTYLTDRNRDTEGGWDGVTPDVAEDAAVIAAADHIENAFSQLFKGRRQWTDISTARATLTLTGNAVDAETVTIGTQVYTWKTTLTGAADEVLIGASPSASIANLVGAVTGDASKEGTTHGTGTVANVDATAVEWHGDTMLVTAKTGGTAGNLVVTTETMTNATWNFATLVGGSDIVVPQPLSFPRVSLFDRDGTQVIGVPTKLKSAHAEYSVRARAATLAADPSIDGLGGSLEAALVKVGPITIRDEYVAGTAPSGTLPAYPAADRLLQEYLQPAGVVR